MTNAGAERLAERGGNGFELGARESGPARDPFRVLILDNVIANAGDAAILIAMKESLEAAFGPVTEVRNCYCGPTSDPRVYRDFYPELRFVRTLWHATYDFSFNRLEQLRGRLARGTAARRFPLAARLAPLGLWRLALTREERELFRHYLEADLIVISGGACLSSAWTSEWLRAYRVAEYETALRLGKPLIFWAQSLGPFLPGDPLPSMLADVMGRADAVICRDAESMKAARERIGLPAAILHETIDEALLLEPKSPAADVVPRRRKPIRVGVCVHRWPWVGADDPDTRQERFEARVAEVCTRLLERGDTEILFLTTHQRVDADMHDSSIALHTDEGVVADVRSAIPGRLLEYVHVIEGFVHPREFACVMGDCDVVLSSRLHGAILTLCGGTPVVALAYEPKTVGLMRQLDLEDWALSMWDSSAEEILAKLSELIERRSDARQKCAEALKTGRTIAMRNRQIALNVVSRRNRPNGVRTID